MEDFTLSHRVVPASVARLFGVCKLAHEFMGFVPVTTETLSCVYAVRDVWLTYGSPARCSVQ